MFMHIFWFCNVSYLGISSSVFICCFCHSQPSETGMQIASFIKTHIFSRRRPIDGWKYMIEVVGPNAKRGKGSVSRVPSLSDPSTQPFKEEKTLVDKSYIPLERR